MDKENVNAQQLGESPDGKAKNSFTTFTMDTSDDVALSEHDIGSTTEEENCRRLSTGWEELPRTSAGSGRSPSRFLGKNLLHGTSSTSCVSTGGMDGDHSNMIPYLVHNNMGDGEDEDVTDDLFSEWRFELASHLSSEPKLLQRIVRLIDRLECENEELKNEKEHQKERIKDLMNEASCMYDRLTSGDGVSRASSSSCLTVGGRNSHNKPFVPISTPLDSPEKKRISEQSNNNSKNIEEIQSITPINKRNLFLYFCGGMMMMFLSSLVLLVSMAAEVTLNVSPVSSLFLAKREEDDNSSSSSVGSDDGKVHFLFGSGSASSSTTTSTTTTTTTPKRALDDDSLSVMASKLELVESQNLELAHRVQHAEAMAIQSQAAAADTHRRYQELNQQCGQTSHDLQILKMFVSRRGPVVDEPGKHCWAEWFTPEICCSPWYGPNGHPGCWSGGINYDSCCGFFSTKDTTSRYGYYAEQALPGPDDIK